ncbi:orotate phosphoribosyltransferase [Paenisporosarcina antarctica]|uniref:Orotate phosphoribosyltransferase n=1 Tax=Paenisporosarcina antarctica TaxID=417367 RepID=A0A4P6ZYG3_9BACL|nr:orotate phosphoribosyltransferase [Paenisporosarcina antarctica]QBP41517.1 orotate phosphoribosyltransferase [Paenisporosarcina antarctica]
MKSQQHEIAAALLSIGAVEFRPKSPFTWTSGIKSPIYCDNRLTMSSPTVRKQIAEALATNIREFFPETNVVAGTATAGIPHAAWVSDVLNLPMVYVRSKAKEHGRGNQIEGKIEAGQKVIVVEDLISTGGSSIDAVHALEKQGCEVLGVVCIFTYHLKRADELFEKAGIPYVSLTNFDALIEEATVAKQISDEDKPQLIEWHQKLKHGQL